jgi:integrase
MVAAFLGSPSRRLGGPEKEQAVKNFTSVTLVVGADARSFTVRLARRAPCSSASSVLRFDSPGECTKEFRPGLSRPDLTFGEFALEWFERYRRTVRKTSADAVGSRLRVGLLPFFGEHRLSAIDTREVDRYQLAQICERDRIEQMRAAAPGPHGRPLSNATINRLVALLGQILDQAVDYGMLAANPARGKRRRLKPSKPPRTYLDSAEQITALLDAASELDRFAVPRYRHIGRRAILSTLVFSGLRIGELLDLRWRDVDFAHGWIHVGQAKTDAGVRRVKLRPVLSRELAAHRHGSLFSAPADYVFTTSAGRRQSPSNVRIRVLERARLAASLRLEAAGAPSLPHLTPHSLRRSFASLLYAIGEPPTIVMSEMGHASPTLALAIYARAMLRAENETERLRGLLT